MIFLKHAIGLRAKLHNRMNLDNCILYIRIRNYLRVLAGYKVEILM